MGSKKSVTVANLACVVKELKTTNEALKSLQTQLELAYASTASSGQPIAGGSIGLGSTSAVSTATTAASGAGGTVLGGSVAVPDGVPGSTTLTAILETKDARIQTLEQEVALLEAELQRIKESSGRLREQLLGVARDCDGVISTVANPAGGATGVSGVSSDQVNSGSQGSCVAQTQLGQGPIEGQGLAKGGPAPPVPYGPSSSSALTSSLILAAPTGGVGGGVGGTASSCLAGISSGASTGVVNPFTDHHHQHHHLAHHLHHHHHHLLPSSSSSSASHHHQYHHPHHATLQQQLLQQQYHQQIQQHLKQIEPAAAGGLALHAHNFNKHDLSFKRQVSFFINNQRIEKNDAP